MTQCLEIDKNRYFKYETDRESYERNFELYNFDKAAEKMELGINFFDKYSSIGKNKLAKYPLKDDWKKAKKYLDKSEFNFMESKKNNDVYYKMLSTLKSNMDNVYKNQEYLEKLKPFLKDK